MGLMGGVNNPENLDYSEDSKKEILTDMIEVVCYGYTIDRAHRLLKHWATDPERHLALPEPPNFKSEIIPERHKTYGRAIPARATIMRWLNDPNFEDYKAAWTEANSKEGTYFLEDVAQDLAIHGDSKLIMFLLKARDPQKYANFGALGGGSFQIQITPSDQDL